MSSFKNTILKKKINDVVYELMIKTTSTMVYVDDTTTLANKLQTMLDDINTSKEQLSTLIGEDEATSITSQIESAVSEAIDALNNEEDSESLAGKIKALNTTISNMNDNDNGILSLAKKYTDDKIGLSDTQYSTVKEYVDKVKDDITTTLGSAFHFKGVVDYISQLPTDNNSNGDIYQVKYRGTEGENPLNAEYVYNGTEWIELGSILDLSSYSTTEEVNALVSTKTSFIVSKEEPENLSENVLWAQIIEI